ncbi:hypothetical protein D3C86_2009240 [compost metagenome]
MKIRLIAMPVLCYSITLLTGLNLSAQKKEALISAEYVDQTWYENLEILPDNFGAPDPKGMLGALHSGADEFAGDGPFARTGKFDGDFSLF